MSDHWYASGNCTDADPSLFDAVGKADQADGGQARIAAAQAICRKCPVINECYREAVRNRDNGVRGGAYFDSKGTPMSHPPKRDASSKIDRLRDAA